MNSNKFINRIQILFILIVAITSLTAAADGFGINATGGAGGTPVTVTNITDFTTYATSPSPYIITVSGSITLGGRVNVTSNKTIQGLDTNATIDGNIKIGTGVSNVIVQYLNITNPLGVGDGDGITVISGAKRIFITHCNFVDCADGMCDITNQADSVTISWCRFRYVNQTTHRYVNLIGSNDLAPDLGYLHVTFHHCWWDELCNERMPSVRFGRVHVYNNYFSSDSALYCVRTRLYAECLVENNYFENVKNPWELAISKTPGTVTGKLRAANNNISFMETTNGIAWVDSSYEDASIYTTLIPGTDTVFTPPYSYALDDAQNVKNIAMAGAGNIYNPGDGVNERPATVAGFSLNQNYPNPFNPTTIISYQLTVTSYISMKVYDTYGREVAVLAEGKKTAGTHQAQFNGAGLASGVYFARLVAEGTLSTIKLVLTK